MSSDPSGFSCILDSLDVSGELPLEIIPNHWFRKAEPQEIDRIKKELSAHRQTQILYEYGIAPSIENKDKSITFLPLPPEEWKYYVISFKGSNDKIRYIEYAADLLENDFSLGYLFFNKSSILPNGVAFDLSKISIFFAELYGTWGKTKLLNIDELREITTNYNLVTALDKTRYSNVLRAVLDFHQTKLITNRSNLKVLAYFSIIECLLTHPPNPSDRVDSLTRQISSKMSLLSKRFQRVLHYESYFPDIAPGEAWKKLYAFRSLIAHGEEVDFSRKYSTLKSNDNLRDFLTESLKLLILYALKEPEFLADLQKC